MIDYDPKSPTYQQVTDIYIVTRKDLYNTIIKEVEGVDKDKVIVEPSGKNNQKGVKINLNVGDMLMYKGCELEHWREPFDGEMCVQVFLHYNKKGKDSNEFDGRLHLGLPNWFKGRKYEQE